MMQEMIPRYHNDNFTFCETQMDINDRVVCPLTNLSITPQPSRFQKAQEVAAGGKATPMQLKKIYVLIGLIMEQHYENSKLNSSSKTAVGGVCAEVSDDVNSSQSHSLN